MPQADAIISQTDQTSQGPRRLAELRARAQAGQAPAPQELALALQEARDRVAALAVGLLLPPDGGPGPEEASLRAYEEALLLCMDLTMLGLELAKRHGPAYLPLPGARP